MMLEEIRTNIIELRESLKNRENKSAIFFDTLIDKIDKGDDSFIDTILSASAIIQYANFTYKEENLFRKIWYAVDKLKR